MNGFVGSRKAKLAKIKYPNAPASIATGNVQFFRKFNIAPSFIFGRKGTTNNQIYQSLFRRVTKQASLPDGAA
ncbi:hypothetical protein PARMER_02895 [Parabacteroides merdae ATCC 43184]|nr:hypothetical protein PARMER_02895 [Parabacteroides merdae ATCC 43184]